MPPHTRIVGGFAPRNRQRALGRRRGAKRCARRGSAGSELFFQGPVQRGKFGDQRVVSRAIGANQVARRREVNRTALDVQQNQADARSCVFVHVAAHAHVVRSCILLDDRVLLGLERIEHHRVGGVGVRESAHLVRRRQSPSSASGRGQRHEQQTEPESCAKTARRVRTTRMSMHPRSVGSATCARQVRGKAELSQRLVITGALAVQCRFLETQVLAGRYRLDRQLGKGGMGSVWLAEHLALNSWVAVKLMDPSIAATVEGAERFKREAQAAASLRSAHVVQVLDYGVHDDTPFLVMELLQGETLADCLEREKRLAPERALSVITQVARAIGRAHAGGIVHRDLKPDNIFLVREDDQELAKVLDFGIAKATGPRFSGMETRTGVTMGTPHYMSPEQVEGKKALDHRSDLWSLAVIACECMTGARPFDGETFGELLLNICARPIVPPSQQGFFLPGFDQWFEKGANRDPALRFASAQELAAALADVVAGRVKPMLLSVPQTTGPEATLPMDPPTLLFSGSQVARAVTARGATDAAVIRPHPGTLSPQKRSALLPVVIALGVAIALGLAVLVLVLRRKAEGSSSSAQVPASEHTPERTLPS